MKHPIRRRLMYLGFRGLQALTQLLPLRVARAVGRALGALAYRLCGSQRRLTLEHLASAMGDSLSASQRQRVAKAVFTNLGQTAMEWLSMPRFSLSDVQRLVTGEGVEHVRAALAQGNGAIVMTPHFGNWELIPLYLRSLGFEGGALARHLRYPEYESFFISMRSRKGVPTFPRGSLKEAAKILRANQILGMLPDQDVDSLDGVFVDFFGRPAHTLVGPAALSVLTGAPIVPCFVIRKGGRFRLIIEPPLRAPQGMDRVQAVTALTREWSRVFESYIRRYPDHWTWMHRRWKTQPAQTATATPATSPLQLQQPVLTMFLLGAYSLVLALTSSCARSGGQKSVEGKGTTPASVSESSADPEASQAMSEFALTGYKPDGGKSWDLKGRSASVDGNIVTIQQPDGVGYDVARTAYLTASVAEVDQTTRHVRLEHDVTIHTTDGLWFTSPVLHWIPDQNQMATDQPVRIETDHILLRGRGATGVTQLKEATILQDIELVLNPSDHERPTGSGPKQVIITCDGPLHFDYGNNVATFENNVHVQDPNGDLYSDQLTAYLDQTTHTIKYAEATGHVRIHQEKNTALSERAVYEPAAGKITMVGKPSLLVYPSSDGRQGAQLSFGGLTSSSEPKQAP